ncbi:Oligopeptide ABC transporter, oligopeptide-binding protein [Geobacillus thermoleovorans CCB_US3_UF5]|uniref:Periplasmic oligopeptide-binding protein OppA n=3 Tax=Geobacillus TaxID=129337 RepID=A0A2Z3N7H6_GEOTH|nr:peptide ABC transporter substrate-binding protein [Geobacillus thermoleovorans]AEV18286.1 Oligopeptide ABC transporter, oligopeptide-binding protein [Geobacillus thermoleovorans CCB_US3_UF5]AWO73639.1 peptide ABC transporter substrate-binding protein [Geobacillus thermoleovorans]QDY72540.1 peptide ABC transporter substrate-binding protein [Geobacillus thermoleovorans]TLS32440.1 peptide ABC transporter substrate-binding protein [Geobacillus thermoleovorans]
MKKRFSFFLVLLLALSTFLAACGGGGDDNAQGGEKPAEKKEQVLNLLETSEIPSLDPALATDQVSFIVLNNVMEGLYRLGKDNKPVPGVAESYTVSEDGKTYTFKLRQDAKWSNGDPVTAHDFVFAWRRVLDPKTKAEYAYIMYDIKNAAAVNTGKLPVDQLGVKALDNYTLQVELENPIPYFISLTVFGTFMPQNEKFVKAQGDKYGLEANTTLYNGPFVLSEWKHEQGWTYAKNPNYWDKDTVKLEKINVKVVKETATMVNLYDTKKADRVILSAEFVDKYKKDKNFHTYLEPSIFWLRMNTKKEPLNNVNARKAIAMAIDKEAMVNTLFNNGSVVANYAVPKDFVTGPDGKDFRDANGDLVSYNVDEAKKLWEQAKKELGKDKFTIELLNYDDDVAKKVGEYLKEQLEKNLPGLTVNIKQQPFKQKLELESNMQYELSFSGWGPDYQDPMTFLDLWTTNNPHNQTGWSNAEYDKLIKDAKTTLLGDLQARWDAMLKAEKILFEEMPIAPLYQRGRAYLQREYVKDIVIHSFGGDYSYKWAYIE